MDTNFHRCSTWSLLLVLIQVPFSPPLCMVCLYIFCPQTHFSIPPWQHIFASSFRGDRFWLILRKMIYIALWSTFSVSWSLWLFFLSSLSAFFNFFSAVLSESGSIMSLTSIHHHQESMASEGPLALGVVAENMGSGGQHTCVWILVLLTTSYVITDKLIDSSPLPQFVHL